MTLAAYLDRIGHTGPVAPDLATLRAIHRAHHFAIPYENLDVQLGRPVVTDPAAAFDKIVTRRRGGWCYEMNGLLGWALGEIGFKVTRMMAGVRREQDGDIAVGNHLILRVDLPDGPWMADVGFGDGPVDPYPIAAGPVDAGLFAYRLEETPGGWWRLHNHPAGGAPSFDFQIGPADEQALAGRCHWLQTDPASNFVLNAVVQRHQPDRLLVLRGRTLRVFTADGANDSLIADADDYVATLKTDFALDLPEAATLWPAIQARHEALFGT
ncbi:MAG: arylamine N-acetyltransferase [Caulobacteraceae bacterium]|nr:MAG: arylamine N-acetyltransferase [Caulobacteraceae bacterium]